MSRLNITGISLLLLMMACTNQSKEKVKQEDDAILIKTVTVENTDYQPAIQYSGIMASTNEIKQSFKIGGIISRINVREGEHVRKGELLAELNLTEINAQTEQTAQAVAKSKRDAERVKNLYADTAATLEQLQNVQTQLEVAQENQRIARFNLSFARITALGDGVISKKIANEGEVIAPGSPAFIINNAGRNDWVIRLGVADKDWSRIHIGDPAIINLDAYPGKTWNGIVSKRAEAADPYSNTYEIEVKVIPNGDQFAAGLFATVQLSTTRVKGLYALPIEALAEADEKKGFVYVLNPDKQTVRKIPVEIAYINKDKVIISKGLENIREVITDGVSYLTETSHVKWVQ